MLTTKKLRIQTTGGLVQALSACVYRDVVGLMSGRVGQQGGVVVPEVRDRAVLATAPEQATALSTQLK